MKPRTPKSIELYNKLLDRGYPREEIADEMLAILSDRNRIMQKHELENTNAKWNQLMMQGFEDSPQNDEEE